MDILWWVWMKEVQVLLSIFYLASIYLDFMINKDKNKNLNTRYYGKRNLCKLNNCCPYRFKKFYNSSHARDGVSVHKKKYYPSIDLGVIFLVQSCPLCFPPISMVLRVDIFQLNFTFKSNLIENFLRIKIWSIYNLIIFNKI